MSGVNASSHTRSTKVIAVADVVESVRLMEHDEHSFIRRWQRFVDFVMQRLPQHAGRFRKSLGDGLMLEFSDAEACIRAALAMRDWFRESNRELGPEEQAHLRIGAHVGDFVADAYDIYGTDVNLAARIASLAGPGEIVISAALRNRLGSALHRQLEDLGSCHLKHVREPVHAFRLRNAGRASVFSAAPLAAPPMQPALTVLPFTVRGDSGDGLSGETLADEIVALLARAGHVQAVSRLSLGGVGELRGSGLRHGTRARYMLTGTARARGQQLALYAELSELSSGHVAWAQSFHGSLGELGAIEGHLTREVVSAVHAAILAREVARARTQPLPTLEAHTLLLASITLMHSLAATDLERARELLEHLVERWPRYSVPHAWLAHMDVLRLQQGAPAAVGQAARARSAAALERDATCPLALAVDGHAALHADGDLHLAKERYAHALAWRPDDALALLFDAERLALEGKIVRARAAAARALEQCPLPPLRPFHERITALTALAAGEMGGAIEHAERSVQANPRSVPAQSTLAAALMLAGEEERARASIARLRSEAPHFTVETCRAGLPECAMRERLAEALLRAGLPRR